MPWFEVGEDGEAIKVEEKEKIADVGPVTFMGSHLPKMKPFTFQPFRFEILSSATTPPLPRSGHRIVSEEGNMYSFGGYLERTRMIGPLGSILIAPNLPAQHLFEELWELNAMTNTWRKLVTYGDAPKELASHSMVLHGHFLVVYGGTGVPFGGSSSNRMHVCDLRKLTWHLVETGGEFPSPQYGQAVVMDKNDAFYVVGGTTGYEYSIDIHKLDMRTFAWECLFIAKGHETEPPARYRHEIALENDVIYILGGGTASASFGLDKIPAFCLKTKTWSQVQTVSQTGKYPKPRKCHGCARRGDDVYISGGYDNIRIFQDIWRLHMPTLEWTQLDVRMPVPTYFHASSISPAGCLFIYGGVVDIKQSTRTAKLYKVWVVVPSLKELAWSAVHHYARATTPSCIDTLKATVPEEFKDRLPMEIPDKPTEYPIPPIRPRVRPPPKEETGGVQRPASV